MPSETTTIEIEIEYSYFVAGREIAEILELCDDAVWSELEELFWPPMRGFPLRYYGRPDISSPPAFCVAKIENGSLLLTGVLGGVALKYCHDRFWRGFKRSGFGDSVEELGTALGNRAGSIVSRLGGWLGKYEEEAKSQKSNIKSIKVRQKKI